MFSEMVPQVQETQKSFQQHKYHLHGLYMDHVPGEYKNASLFLTLPMPNGVMCQVHGLMCGNSRYQLLCGTPKNLGSSWAPAAHQLWESKWIARSVMQWQRRTREHGTTMLVRAGTGYYPNASHTYWRPTWNYNCCKHGQVNSYCSYGLIGFLTGAFTVQCAWFGDWVSIEADGDVQ